MGRRLARFQRVKKFQPKWINMIKAQYIVHRIFKDNGLIKKYLNHQAIKDLPEEQQIFLQLQSAEPWRYSFAEITANPEKDFRKKSTKMEEDNLEKLNRLLTLALPFINAGQTPDVEALAKQAGVDIETAHELLNHSIERINKLWDDQK